MVSEHYTVNKERRNNGAHVKDVENVAVTRSVSDDQQPGTSSDHVDNTTITRTVCIEPEPQPGTSSDQVVVNVHSSAVLTPREMLNFPDKFPVYRGDMIKFAVITGFPAVFFVVAIVVTWSYTV